MVMSKQSKLVTALREQTAPLQLFSVPVSVTKGQENALEFTQRSRSFLFATLAVVVAHLFRRNTVRFYENGIVSLNLPVSAHVLGARATRSAHPKVLADFSRLFSLILDEPVMVENPYFWKTKSDVVTTIAEHGCADLIAETFSCARVREATRRGRHCGACSQCIDRRFGILGAGLGEYEPAETYVVDLFRGERKPGPDVVMAESYVLHALKLASMSEQTFLGTFGQVFRVLPYLPGSQEDNAARLHELHRRHGRIIEEVINRELAHYATLAKSLSLPETSLLMLIQSSAVRLPTMDPAEAEPSASEQAAAGDHGRALERPLVFALDEKGRKVLFRNGVEIGGAGFELVAKLVVEFVEDVKAARPHDEFRFVKATTLAERLGIDQQGLRQQITRFRRSIRRKFLDAVDRELADDDVIQNDPGRGYRLNPYVLLVQPSQISAS
jgi:7-cyano-7-deazaguanine synthase in queuosine biosynthesis